MPDDARIQAAISGAERFLNDWQGRPMRARLSEIADATGEDERADVYGTGERIERLEGRIAEILGAESAVFMPSGTMAQQIALRIWSDRRGRRTVAFHPTCHLEIHEQKGYQLLHGLHGRLVGDPNRLITLSDLDLADAALAVAVAEGVPVRRSRSHHIALRAAPRSDGRRRHATARAGGGGSALQGRDGAGEPAVMAMPCRAGEPP